MNRGTIKRISQFGGALCVATFVAAPTHNASAEAGADCEEDASELSGKVAHVAGTCPKLRFKIGEVKVLTHEKTVYEGGFCRDVTKARQVEVAGTWGTDGTLTACKIEFEDDQDGDHDEQNDEKDDAKD